VGHHARAELRPHRHDDVVVGPLRQLRPVQLRCRQGRRRRLDERPRPGRAQERHPGEHALADGRDAHDAGPDPARYARADDPESITPGLLYLVSEDAPTRTILCAGAGAFALAQIIETQGAYFPEGERTPEAIAARFAEIADPAGAEALAGALQQTDKFVHMAAEAEGISLGAGNQEKAP
jgi:hypothetical protein